jgi:hypothetical protein
MARGATAITNAARVATTLYPMTPAEGRIYGIDPSRQDWYVRLDRAKGNYSAPGTTGKWFEKISVGLTIEDDPTGTLQPVYLESAIQNTEDNVLRRALADAVLPGRPASVYSLATRFRSDGTIDGSHRTVMRKIEDLLAIPYEQDGMVWEVSQLLAGKGNKVASHVSCKPNTER